LKFKGLKLEKCFYGNWFYQELEGISIIYGVPDIFKKKEDILQIYTNLASFRQKEFSF